MTPGPADEARRALRAARERQDPVPGGAAEGGDAVRSDPAAAPPTVPEAEGDRSPEPRSSSQPRPADAARAALRRAVSARRAATRDAGDDGADGDEAGRTPDGSPAGTSADAAAGGGAVTDTPDGALNAASDGAPGDEADRPGDTAGRHSARPGDAAREALRAALKEAAQTRTDAAVKEDEAIGPRARPASAASRARSGTRADAGVRARAVRDLLADAFRLPADADPARDESRDTPRTVRTGASRHGQPPRPHRPSRPTPSGPGDPAAPGVGDRAAVPGPGDQAPVPGPSDPTPHHRSLSDAPSTPQASRSMAAPHRDGELRRTFPAFPPRPSDGQGFAETWWGNAWVTALEEGALDAQRLARGRGYAAKGYVDAITVTPGLVLAYVQGSRPRPYRVQVRLRTLEDAEWERFLDAAAERPGHIAALLDKELPQSLADCGVPLLPGPGELAPHCSCPDSGHPCKHAAALCYQTARLLDADPFVLLLLRGRGERDLLDALSRLSATRAARAAQDREPAPLPGLRAAAALARRELPPLPAPLPAPPHPEQPPVYPAAPGGPDPFTLDQLATDAAARAHALLTTGRDPVGQLTLWQDAVRLAAARPGSGLTAGTRALYSSLASAAGRTTAELARAVAAWRQGGSEGLAVLEEPWDPPAGRFDRARPLLLAADLPAFRPWRNRLTHPHGHLQLRLGRDGLWYAYESEPHRDDWWPRGTPDLDPVGALTGLGIPSDL